jgi:hypothetical protein
MAQNLKEERQRLLKIKRSIGAAYANAGAGASLTNSTTGSEKSESKCEQRYRSSNKRHKTAATGDTDSSSNSSALVCGGSSEAAVSSASFLTADHPADVDGSTLDGDVGSPRSRKGRGVNRKYAPDAEAEADLVCPTPTSTKSGGGDGSAMKSESQSQPQSVDNGHTENGGNNVSVSSIAGKKKATRAKTLKGGWVRISRPAVVATGSFLHCHRPTVSGLRRAYRNFSKVRNPTRCI